MIRRCSPALQLAAGLAALGATLLGAPLSHTGRARAAGTCTLVLTPSSETPPSGPFDNAADVISTFDHARQAEGCNVTLSIDPNAFDSASPQMQMFMLFNAERRDRGLPTLQLDSTLLSQIDLNHSREMAQYGYFNHPSPINQPGPNNVFARLTVNPAISGHWTNLGENIAQSFTTSAAAVYTYMYQDSASNWGHRHNILGTFDWVGVGVATGGPGHVYYTSGFLQDPAAAPYTPPAAADTQAPTMSAPAITSGTAGGSVTVQASNVRDTGANPGEAGVTDVVFYANQVTMDSSGNANTVVGTPSGTTWTATLSLPAGATVHAVAVDGSGNFTDCAAGQSCGSTSGQSQIRAGVIGTDNQLYAWQPSGGFVPLGGGLLAAPAVGLLPAPQSGQPPQALYVGLGTDHNLYVRSDGQGWQRLTTAPTYCLDSPALLLSGAVGNASITVACQGGDHGLWTASGSFTSGLPTVGPWSGLEGLLTYGPALAVVNGQVTYFAIGSDSSLYSRTVTTGWSPLPWQCIGHPAVATSGTASYLACQGLNHALYYATNGGGGWSAPAYAGGALIDGPGIAATGSGATFYVEGTDQGLYQTSLPAGGTATTGWAADGGRIQFGAAAAGL